MKYILIISTLFLIGCSTSSHITNTESFEMQKEMHSSRTAGNVVDGTFSVIFGILDMVIGGNGDITYGAEQKFRKINIKNESTDTLIVNMVTDYFWKEDHYCDIRDIIIPPNDVVKVITPIGANYNVYFRSDPEAEDEMIEINTSGKKTIKLRPGMTILPPE